MKLRLVYVKDGELLQKMTKDKNFLARCLPTALCISLFISARRMRAWDARPVLKLEVCSCIGNGASAVLLNSIATTYFLLWVCVSIADMLLPLLYGTFCHRVLFSIRIPC